MRQASTRDCRVTAYCHCRPPAGNGSSALDGNKRSLYDIENAARREADAFIFLMDIINDKSQYKTGYRLQLRSGRLRSINEADTSRWRWRVAKYPFQSCSALDALEYYIGFRCCNMRFYSNLTTGRRLCRSFDATLDRVVLRNVLRKDEHGLGYVGENPRLRRILRQIPASPGSQF